jgi:ABC-type branched-subunit amino acid transport system ATPase component
MKLNFSQMHKSIKTSVSESVLPEFVVLVGPNGAGKSHLLEAILQGAITIDGVQSSQDPRQSEIKMFSLGSLVPNSGGEQPPAQFRDVWGRIKPQIIAFAQQFGYPNTSESLKQNSDAYLIQLSQGINIPKLALETAQQFAGKMLPYFSDQDFREYFPLYASTGDLFQYSVTDVFLTYFSRWDSNKYQKFLNIHEGVKEATWIEDAEFVTRYGRAPWDVLDEVLELMGLTYGFVKPVNLPPDVPYQPRLLASDTGAEVELDALSSGEKVLLALALGLYAGEHLNNSVKRPKLLLLDEADASLHPKMIRSLLYVAEMVLEQEHGVSIILATHSPTTVALAPEESLYSLTRVGQPRLTKVSREVALAQLTVGIPTLSVRVEDRLQVFVESEKDERYYDSIYTSLKSYLDVPFTLQFIASGSGGAGSCDAVISLVGALRAKGNHSVFGVVDRDENRQGSPNYVMYMAERYAIENFVLDPLSLGLFLLRSRIRKPEQLGLAAGTIYFNVQENDVQGIVNSVQSEVLNVPNGDSQTVSYVGGSTAQMFTWYGSMQGHSLEARVLDAYPQLRCHSDLMGEICKTVVAEMPGFVPAAFVDLFRRLGR